MDWAIDIFEMKTNGFIQGLFIFDNATTHKKHPDDGLSALELPKNPKETWT